LFVFSFGLLFWRWLQLALQFFPQLLQFLQRVILLREQPSRLILQLLIPLQQPRHQELQRFQPFLQLYQHHMQWGRLLLLQHPFRQPFAVFESFLPKMPYHGLLIFGANFYLELVATLGHLQVL